MPKPPFEPESGPSARKNSPDKETRPSVQQSAAGDVRAFLKRAQAVKRFSASRSRLLFAIDATASRQPTWDLACQLQADMFRAGEEVASLSVQLAYFRGLGELHFSAWHTDTRALAEQMSAVQCMAGRTQVARLLRNVLKQQAQTQARALIFIGDAVEEADAQLRDLAGQCRLHALPLFIFQEGHDPGAEECFRAMAKISGGAYDRFNSASASRLRELLGAVARYAAGGRAALEDSKSAGAIFLLEQLGP